MRIPILAPRANSRANTLSLPRDQGNGYSGSRWSVIYTAASQTETWTESAFSSIIPDQEANRLTSCFEWIQIMTTCSVFCEPPIYLGRQSSKASYRTQKATRAPTSSVAYLVQQLTCQDETCVVSTPIWNTDKNLEEKSKAHQESTKLSKSPC